MANPDVADLHVNAMLTNISIGYTNPEYVADRVFPLVGVNKQSDIVPEYDKSFWFRDDARIRAPGGELHYGEYKVTKTDTYFCHNYQFAIPIPDEQAANADAPFMPERDATRLVTDKLQLRREVAFATDFMVTSVWGTDDDNAATDWSDYANSDPISNAETAALTIRQAIGRRPNKLVLADDVWQKLKNHPLLLDRINGAASPGNPAIVTKALVAALLELEEILVISAIKTSSDEGVAEASATYTDVSTKDALFIYVPANPGLFTPAAGYTFYWRPLTGGGPQFVRRIRDEKQRRTEIDAHSYFDQKKTCAKAGYFFNTIIA